MHTCLVEKRLSCETNCGRTKKPRPTVSRPLSRHIQCCCPEYFVSCFMTINWVLWVLSAMEYLRGMLSNKYSGEELLFSSYFVQVGLLGLSAEPHAADKGNLVFHSLLHTHRVSPFILFLGSSEHFLLQFRSGMHYFNQIFFSLETLCSISNFLNCQKWEYSSTHSHTEKYVCVNIYTYIIMTPTHYNLAFTPSTLLSFKFVITERFVLFLPILFHCITSNYCLQATCGLQPFFVNKVLWKHSTPVVSVLSILQ